MRRLAGHLAIGYAALLCTAMTGAGPPSKGVFVYSSLCSGEEDAGGAQIVLIRDATGNAALFTPEGTVSEDVMDVRSDAHVGHLLLPRVRNLPAKLPRCGK